MGGGRIARGGQRLLTGPEILPEPLAQARLLRLGRDLPGPGASE